MWTGTKIGIRVGDITVDVEEIFVVNADPATPHKGYNVGWRLHRPCGSPPMDFWDVRNAALSLFAVGYGRNATAADAGHIASLQRQLESI